MANFATVIRVKEASGAPRIIQVHMERKAIMKMTTKLALLVATIAVALFVLIPNLSWAEDGAAIFKAKCAACHGADGAGEPAAKIPAWSPTKPRKCPTLT